MPATYAKPTTIPRWNDDLTNNTEPPEAKKDAGWIFQEIPPSTWENWKAQLNGQWWKWLDERLADGSDENELVIKAPDSGADAIKINAALILTDRRLSVTGQLDGQFGLYSQYINVGGAAPGGVGDGIFAGGLNVGFDADPATDTVAIGDANVRLDASVINTPRWYTDASSWLGYDRPSASWGHIIAGSQKTLLDASGLRLLSGLYVGSIGIAPWNDDIRVAGGINCGGSVDPGVGEGVFTDSIAVGFDGVPAGADRVYVGDSNFYVDFDGGTSPGIQFEAGASYFYTRSANRHGWFINSNYVLSLTETVFQPEQSGNTDLGGTSNLWDTVFANNLEPRDNTTTSTNATSVARRTIKNSITACCYVNGAGTINTAYPRMNIASVSKSAPGIWLVNLAFTFPGRPLTLVTPHNSNTVMFSGMVGPSFNSQAIVQGNDNLTGAAKDTDFDIAFIGAG